MRFFLPVFVFLVVVACDSGESSEDVREQADVLFNSGLYPQALSLYEDAMSQSGEYDWSLQYRLAETAVLASQLERNRTYRQKAKMALDGLMQNSGEGDSLATGQLWRRLGWEMVRDSDSLQAFEAFDKALQISPGLSQVFEEEWLVRGKYASFHLASVAGVTDSIVGTGAEDSLLKLAAEKMLVELDRIPLVRTDLRGEILSSKARLFHFTDGREEDELAVLTELDRMGLIDPSSRQRRMELLLMLASRDLDRGDAFMARERLLEVWNSNFTGVRVEAAFNLGVMAEKAGDAADALSWYNRACNASPGLNSSAAIHAAEKRDSLRYLVPAQ